ncbi:MAG: murein biosynthesis integral membrane protein MurJ [Planctomycetaceae bacterium]|nr:murein biosynthesis integral membrane protein MurJ [Planctomycetaceae bacterium]
MDDPGNERQTSRLRGFSTVSLLTLLSRITGLARDALMASVFGTGMLLDGFTLAFRIPNMARRLLGDGAMAAAFLPEFVREDRELGRSESVRLLDSVARHLAIILLSIIVPAESVLLLWRFGLPVTDRVAIVLELTAILLPFMLMVCLTALVGAALNSIHRFRIAAFTPVLLNLTWLIAGSLLALTSISIAWQIRLISAAIVAGGLLQLVVSVIAAGKAGIAMRWPWQVLEDEDLRRRRRRVFAVIIPALAGLSLSQVNALVDAGLAWGLASTSGTASQQPGEIHHRQAASHDAFADPFSGRHWHFQEGTASALYLGQRLFQFPMGVFGIALGTVLFPRFARHAAAGRRDEFASDIHYGLRLVILIGIPASLGLWLLAEPIARLLFQRGRFDEHAVHLTASMIAIHGVGVWIFSALLITHRAFYADSDQLTPIRQGVICVILNLILDIVLIPVLHEQALPWATNMATLGQLMLAMFVLHRRGLLPHFVPLCGLFLRSAVAASVMFLAGSLILSQLPSAPGGTAGRLLLVAVPITGCVATYFATLSLMRFRWREMTGES